MDICGILRFWVVCYSFKFLWVHAELSFSNDHSKVLDFFLFESTFFRFQVEIVGFQFVQYFMDVFSMPFQVLFVRFIVL